MSKPKQISEALETQIKGPFPSTLQIIEANPAYYTLFKHTRPIF